MYRDTHLLDTFYDAGGNNNFAMVASGVISRWLWPILYLPVSGAVYTVSLRSVVNVVKDLSAVGGLCPYPRCGLSP